MKCPCDECEYKGSHECLSPAVDNMWEACGPYARYLGQQEGQSERDALRAEVAMLRRALAFLAKQISSVHGACPADCDCDHYPDLSCKDSLSAWAISEARKGE